MALTQAKMTEIENMLNKMKENGIAGGVMKKDGVVVKSTIGLTDIAPVMLARAVNVSDAMMQREGNKQKEVELSFGNETIVVVPISVYLFFGVSKTKEQKKTILEFSKKAEAMLG